MTDASKGPLDGLVVLDLTRILAGPTATQMLGDLGATVWKIENPERGDDTRAWGPPYADTEDGIQDLSAYFLSANRNKMSVAVDLALPEGQAQIRKLAARADIMVENFKPGGLVKYGLDPDTLRKAHPGLITCSISGFGQTGPNREKPGYDLMAQGYGGIMSLTGAPDGPPMKVGVGIADVMCGMYAATGILAALHHRTQTGEGQSIDVALVDTQMAWLINEGTNTLMSGKIPERRGNAHPNIVPYDVFDASDGHVIVAVGNDAQFARFCDALGLGPLHEDPSFVTNPARITHRDALMLHLRPALTTIPAATIIQKLEAAKVPVGPIHDLNQALATDQAKARDAVIEQTQNGATLKLLGNPLKFSATPVQYTRPPPRLGEHTGVVLGKTDTEND
ncbi:CaiB/BaiF CoA transferase family protein [Aestuariibius insulae]|uniref:CaiB/BaiF CoA transferase family protein n=1 Tax=Aestuariibius insulae TaxID=2058287 RepID=UPI00345E9C0A